jgi:hypothetical protein
VLSPDFVHRNRAGQRTGNDRLDFYMIALFFGCLPDGKRGKLRSDRLAHFDRKGGKTNEGFHLSPNKALVIEN